MPDNYNGQLKSETASFPVYGNFQKGYDTTGMTNENTEYKKVGM